MIEIKLTKGKVAMIDDCDAHLTEYKWFYHNTRYACRNQRKDDGTYSMMSMHHAIVGFPLNGYEIDHINNDRTDNRRENLRIVNHRKNSLNRLDHKHNKFRGITKKRKKWQAQIQIDGRHISLGVYRTPEEAQSVYLKECEKVGV